MGNWREQRWLIGKSSDGISRGISGTSSGDIGDTNGGGTSSRGIGDTNIGYTSSCSISRHNTAGALASKAAELGGEKSIVCGTQLPVHYCAKERTLSSYNGIG